METRLMASLETYLEKKLADSVKELHLSLRMNFSRFNKNNIDNWLCQCENYFIVKNIADEFKVQVATGYLEGITLEWHKDLVTDRNCFELSWKEYSSLLSKRFEDRHVGSTTKLKCLRQTRTVKEYQIAFNSVVNDSTIQDLNLPESYIVSCFLGGLKRDIHLVVSIFDPPTVEKAFMLARLYERATLGYRGTLNSLK